LAAFDGQFAQQLQQLQAEHQRLRERCSWWEAAARRISEQHSEPLPDGPSGAAEAPYQRQGCEGIVVLDGQPAPDSLHGA
jgi:hypothetical protein